MAANLLRKYAEHIPIWLAKFLGNLWPPYLGAGIRILYISDDYRYIKVCLKRTWYNKNYVGTQFGGSIYAMTDPFYMLQLINNLGSDYIVWDKAASVDFKKPGKSNLYAEFKIDQKLLDEVILKTNSQDKYIFDLPVEVKDDAGHLIAQINKTLYVRKKLKPF
ncbi:MAG: DUF4442 domain-containing protein [Bdellovibrionales bacterium]